MELPGLSNTACKASFLLFYYFASILRVPTRVSWSRLGVVLKF